MEFRGVLTAAVPKIAPLAPTEGIPTKAKFPPRTFLIIKNNLAKTNRIESMNQRTQKFQQQNM